MQESKFNRSLAELRYEGRPFSLWETIYHRGLSPFFRFVKAHGILLFAALVLTLLVVAGAIGVPLAWQLGPAYFEAIGTWVGAVGGIVAILVAGGALYHQRVVDQRADQARQEAIDFDQSELLVRMVAFADVSTYEDSDGVWCVDFSFSLSERFHHTIYAARAHGINSDPFEVDLEPRKIAPGESARARLRFPEISEEIVRLNEDMLRVDFICWRKGWTARPGGHVLRNSRIEWRSPGRRT